MFFCNTCNAPSYIVLRRWIATISAANRRSGGEDGWYREKFRNFYRGWSQIQKQHFSRLTLWPSCAQPTENSFTPNQWYRWKAETLKVCLLLVWRVFDQAFGKYRSLKDAEKSWPLRKFAYHVSSTRRASQES